MTIIIAESTRIKIFKWILIRNGNKRNISPYNNMVYSIFDLKKFKTVQGTSSVGRVTPCYHLARSAPWLGHIRLPLTHLYIKSCPTRPIFFFRYQNYNSFFWLFIIIFTLDGCFWTHNCALIFYFCFFERGFSFINTLLIA